MQLPIPAPTICNQVAQRVGCSASRSGRGAGRTPAAADAPAAYASVLRLLREAREAAAMRAREWKRRTCRVIQRKQCLGRV